MVDLELKIDKEFAGLCPDLTIEELDLLEASLTTEGCREPIVVWANHDNTILDGHNRCRICQRFNIPFKIKAMKFDTREECVNWIIANQLGRRNLTEEQKEFLRGKRYLTEKKAESGRADRDLSGGQSDHPKTAKRLAKKYGVSEKTIRRDAKFAKAVDEIEKTVGAEAKAAVLSGKSGLSKKDVVAIADMPPDKQRKAFKKPKKPRRKKGTSDDMVIIKSLHAIEYLSNALKHFGVYEDHKAGLLDIKAFFSNHSTEKVEL